jgi:adenosylmethionine-8-amino-7-oxononanoate aminotransferase
MDILPSGKEQRLLLENEPHGTADFTAGHTFSPNQFGCAVGTKQINLGMTVTEDVDVSRLVIVNEDNHAQTMGAKHGDHVI